MPLNVCMWNERWWNLLALVAGVAAHPLLSEAEKPCLIYNARTHTDFVDDNGNERVWCRQVAETLPNAPALRDRSFLWGGLFQWLCWVWANPQGFCQTWHAFVPNTCCKVTISWFLIQHLKLLLSPWWEFEALSSNLFSAWFSLSSEKVDKRIFKRMKVIFLLKTIKAIINSTYCLVIEMKRSNFSFLSCTYSFFHWTLHLLRIFIGFSPISAFYLWNLFQLTQNWALQMISLWVCAH